MSGLKDCLGICQSGTKEIGKITVLKPNAATRWRKTRGVICDNCNKLKDNLESGKES